jgi:hypothetical protein
MNKVEMCIPQLRRIIFVIRAHDHTLRIESRMQFRKLITLTGLVEFPPDRRRIRRFFWILRRFLRDGALFMAHASADKRIIAAVI